MALHDLTQAERAELGHVEPVHLVEVQLASTLLRLCTRPFRYSYGSTHLLYEDYLQSISGLGSAVNIGGSLANSNIQLLLKNKPFGAYGYLAQINEDEPITRATVTVYEVRIVAPGEVFATDIRTKLWRGCVQRVEGITDEQITLACSSKVYDLRNSLGLGKLTKKLYPKADPNDIGKYRNKIFGAAEKVPARCIYTGAIDLLLAKITASDLTFQVSGVARIPFSSGVVTLQIDDEVLEATYTAATKTFTVASLAKRGIDGTTAAPHGKKSPVFEVLSGYVYELADHPVHSIGDVFVEDLRQVDEGTLTIKRYTGQAGSQHPSYPNRAVIEFDVNPSIKQQTQVLEDAALATAQGSHSHAVSGGSQVDQAPDSVTPDKGGSSGPIVTGSQNLKVAGSTTPCILGVSPPYHSGTASVSVTFKKPAGITTEHIASADLVMCGCVSTSERFSISNNIWDGPISLPFSAGKEVSIPIPVSGFPWNPTITFSVSDSTPPAFSGPRNAYIYGQVKVRFKYGPIAGASPASGVATTTTASAILSGQTTADMVIGTEVTADVEGYEDPTGDYGGAGALIERPDHVFKFLLCGLMGGSLADIGSSFADSGAIYAWAGYSFAFLMHDVATSTPELFAALARQCRSIFYEWGGQYELSLLPDAAPAPSFTIEPADILELVSYGFTDSSEIKNHLYAYYRRDYRGQTGRANQEATVINPDATAKGYMDMLEGSAAAADLDEDLLLAAVNTSAMAQSILDFWLFYKQNPRKTISATLRWRAIQTGPGQYFTYTDPIFGSIVFELLEFQPNQETGTIKIKGLEFPSSIAPLRARLIAISALSASLTIVPPGFGGTIAEHSSFTASLGIISANAGFDVDANANLTPTKSNSTVTGWWELNGGGDLEPRSALSGSDPFFETDGGGDLEIVAGQNQVIVPDADGEGSLGTASLPWGNLGADSLSLSSRHRQKACAATTPADSTAQATLWSKVFALGDYYGISVHLLGTSADRSYVFSAYWRGYFYAYGEPSDYSMGGNHTKVGADCTTGSSLKAEFVSDTETMTWSLVVTGINLAVMDWTAIVEEERL